MSTMMLSGLMGIRMRGGALAVCLAIAALLLEGHPATAKGREVAVDFGFAPGTIVIVNDERRLYYVLGDGRAIQYPIAVGTRGELWVGRTFVSNMRKNPPWTPVDGGGRTVPGGIPSNPLGKRALYLDWSLLRIHGTPSRGSIGRAASDGCIRMLNEDVIDLYERVHIGAPVIAINTRSEAGRFAAAEVTGKQPARGRRASAE